MPTYKKASLAKKPGATKKTPLSKRPVKKVPIKKKALGATKLSSGNEVVKLGEGYKARTSGTKKKLPDPPRNSVRSKADSVVTGPKSKAKKKATKPKSRGGR